MVTTPDLQFLSKIRDRLGYLLIQDGTIFKSEGDLVNDGHISQAVQKMMAINGPNILAGEKFNEISIHYSDHYYTINLLEDGSTILVLKRRKTPADSAVDGSTMHLID